MDGLHTSGCRYVLAVVGGTPYFCNRELPCPDHTSEVSDEELHTLAVEIIDRLRHLSPERKRDLLSILESVSVSAKLETDIELRRQAAATVLKQMADKAASQESCPHRHFMGTTHLSYVYDNETEYLICQVCQKLIYHDDPAYPELRDEVDVYLASVADSFAGDGFYPDEKLYLMSLDELRQLAKEPHGSL